MTPDHRTILRRYYADLSGIPQKYAHLPAAEVQAVMKKTHAHWKTDFPAGDEFETAAKTILNACNQIILGKMTLEQAKERCEPLWKEPE